MTLYIENVGPMRGNRIAFIGTSLIQQADIGTVTPKVSTSSRGWFRWAEVLSKGIFYSPIWFDSSVVVGWEPSQVGGTTRYFYGLNAGVSGQTYLQVSARRAYLATLDCDIVVLDSGTNDMGTVASATIQAQREADADYYLSLGKIVVLLPILARGTSSWGSAGTARQRANYINRKTREFANSRRNCFFFDWNEAWVDKTQATNTIMKSGYSGDDIHPIPAGGYFIGKAFAAFLATILPTAQPRVWSQDDIWDATENTFGNLFTDAFLNSTGGTNGTGASGSVVGGFQVERNSGSSTVINSIETRSDGRGKYQVMTFALIGSAVDLFYMRTAPSSKTHSLAAGTWVEASCEIDVSAYPFRGVSLQVFDGGTGGMTAYAMEPSPSGTSSTDNWQGTEGFTGMLRTPPFQIVSGSTTLRWRVEIRLDTTQAGSPVVKVGAVEMRPVKSPITVLGASNNGVPLP